MTTSRPAARGFTLMEVLVALALLGVGAAVMVAPLYRYAQTVDSYGVVQARNAVLAQQAGRLMSLPFDSLDSRAGCTTQTTGTLAHTRCVTAVTVSSRQKRITIVITPASRLARADTVIFDRSKPTAANPFNQ